VSRFGAGLTGVPLGRGFSIVIPGSRLQLSSDRASRDPGGVAPVMTTQILPPSSRAQAKQSRLSPRRQAGLLRRVAPRNWTCTAMTVARLCIPAMRKLPVVHIFSCAVGQIKTILPRVPHPIKRGASRSSRTLEAGCDGRNVAADECRYCGRRNRVVLAPL